jgi:hypothetical protein
MENCGDCMEIENWTYNFKFFAVVQLSNDSIDHIRIKVSAK